MFVLYKCLEIFTYPNNNVLLDVDTFFQSNGVPSIGSPFLSDILTLSVQLTFALLVRRSLTTSILFPRHAQCKGVLSS